uniref:Uncharacterized protein n=1 Tax=Globodera pallida TaxID=36090 RepID=A0A183BJX7_GLOPA
MMDNKSNVQASEQQPSALYTFVKQYFVEIIGKKTPVPTSKEKLLHCTLFSFGWELHFRVRFTYKEFLDYFFAKSTDECKDVYSIETLDSFMLEFFNEPLRNYTSVIQIDVDQCKGVRQFAEALAEHFLERLYALTESKLASICEIGAELDIVPDYLQEENVEKLRQKKVQQTFNIMHMSNSTPTTFYEILKSTQRIATNLS